MKISLPFSFCFLLLLIVMQQPLQAQYWQLTGNSGTSPSTHFLGTIDNKAVVFRTNNIQRLRITTSGNVGIGISTPLQKLDVKGSINIDSGFGLYMQNHRVLFVDSSKANVFLGNGAHNSSGSFNTADGYYALYSNTTGYYNISNGSFSLFSNTEGYSNTANGYKSLYTNTTGNNNTANGSSALFSNTMGIYNTANGTNALYSNTTGNYNTASGTNALYSNNGDYNTATGNRSLYSNTGAANTANGYSALYSNTTGSFSTAQGYQALFSNTTGNGNTAIGYAANVASGDLTNATAIGYNAIVDAKNKVQVGNAAVISIGGQVAWTAFSDGRYKKNIKEDVKGLVFINSLRPITYTVDINGLRGHYDKGRERDSGYEKERALMQPSMDEAAKIVYNGFIAQEVEKAAQSIGYDFSGVDKPQTKDGLYGLRYSDFVVPLVKAVQELSKQNNELGIINDELKKKDEQQQTHIYDLESRLAKLESLMNGNSSVNHQQVTMNEKPEMPNLEQNIPNPFNNTTTINYTLSPIFTSARLIVTDKMGKILKEINVSGSGKGSLKIDASTLSSGAYQYSLYADGKMVDTKQMELLK